MNKLNHPKNQNKTSLLRGHLSLHVTPYLFKKGINLKFEQKKTGQHVPSVPVSLMSVVHLALTPYVRAGGPDPFPATVVKNLKMIFVSL